MSIEAMKQALDALEGINDEDRDKDFLNLKQFVRLDMAIEALRTAIQQAEAKTDEPVAWVVMNGLSKYQVCGAKAPADALCAEMQKRHDLSGSLAAFHVQPLYTHPAPGVPDGYVLVPIEPTEKMLLAYTGGALTEAGFRWCRHQWAAMLAASHAQKGQP